MKINLNIYRAPDPPPETNISEYFLGVNTVTVPPRYSSVAPGGGPSVGLTGVSIPDTSIAGILATDFVPDHVVIEPDLPTKIGVVDQPWPPA